jgi:POT family proton-dependent oligopeptide transporter
MILKDATPDKAFTARAVLRLSSIEFWERYCFYNMFALLALFAAAPVDHGGMGWSDGQALRFFGVYLLTVTLAPLFGGFITDRWLRGDRSLKAGAALLVVGHSLFMGPNLIPWLVEHFTGAPMLAILQHAGAPLGRLVPPPGVPANLALPYLGISVCFYGAVVFVAIGSALFKPILTVVIGRLPHANGAERNGAFTTFFLFANIGGLFSTLLGGWLAQSFGWGWAFAAAAAGMVVALFAMTAFKSRYIEPFLGGEPRREDGGAAVIPSRSPGLAGAVLLSILIVSAVCSYQSYGFVSLFTANLVDRTIVGFTVPPSWFTAVNPVTIMVLTPILMRAWRKGGLGHDWSATGKFAAGFFLMALAFCGLAAAAAQAHGPVKANPLWIVGAIALIAAEELLTSPAGLAAITRLAPEHRQNIAVGAYGAAAGVGAWLSGKVGALAIEAGPMRVLPILAGASLLCGLLLVWQRRRLAAIAI